MKHMPFFFKFAALAATIQAALLFPLASAPRQESSASRSGSSGHTLPPAHFSDTDFVQVRGTKLVNADGSGCFLKGMSFGNMVWGNPPEPPKYHHTKESYTELKKMGFNSVRFYINYRLFEDDAHPYKYKAQGFEWLNKNIAWAKEAGIRLIVNMHVPQGGFQSNGGGKKLYTDKELQNRLKSLWKAIALYYSQCSTIIGWGIVNEPFVPFKDNPKTSAAQYHELAQEIVREIRQADKNHVLFVERLLAVSDEKGRYIQLSPKDYFPAIDDSNTVWELHSYEPMLYTHQKAEWVQGADKYDTRYPDESLVLSSQEKWLRESTVQFRDICGFPEKWTEVSYEISADDIPDANLLRVSIKPSLLKKGGTLFIDDISVVKISSDGTQTVLKEYGFDSEEQWYFGSNPKNPGGTYRHESGTGHSKKGCIAVQGTKDWAYLSSPDNILLEKGCTYRLTLWAKFQGVSRASSAAFGFDVYSATNAAPFTKDGLSLIIKEQLDGMKERGKPVYIGEFGCIRGCFEKNRNGISRGGTGFVTDCIELYRQYPFVCGFNYHTYHEHSFGLHFGNAEHELPSNKDLNRELDEAFRKILPSIQ